MVGASSESSFGDHLRSFDARDLPYWRSFVGEPLVSASVLSLEGDPDAILLDFSTGSVLVWVAGGEGSMYVSWPSSKSYLADLETLWTSDEPDVIRKPEFKGALIDDRAPPGPGEVPLGVLVLGFVAAIMVLGMVPRLHPWLGLAIATVLLALAGVGYRIGEGFFIHLLRFFLAISSIGSAGLLVRNHWFV